MTAACAVLCLLSLPALAQSEIDILKEELSEAAGEARVEKLNQISKAYWSVSSDGAMDYGRQAQALAVELGNLAGEAEAWRNIGIAYWYKSDYDASLEATLSARTIYSRIGDFQGEAASLSTIGTIYLNIEDFARAQDYYLQGLALVEDSDDYNRIGIILSNLGTTNLGLEDFEAALDYFQRSLVILEEHGSKLSVLTCLANIGGAYQRMGRYEEALNTNLEVLALAREQESITRIADALADIGEAYDGLGQLELAEDYMQRGIDFAREQDIKRSLRDAYDLRSKFYERHGRLAEALADYKEYITLRRLAMDQETAAAMADMEVRYETEAKQRAIEIQQLQIEQQRTVQYALTALTGLAVLASIVVLTLYQAKRHANVKLDLLSRTDPLTKLNNRRAVQKAAPHLMGRMARQGTLGSVVLIDIDEFKYFNDRYGHACGDAVIQAVAERITQEARVGDIAARWGGEEFLLLLPDTDEGGAYRIAERIITVIRSQPVEFEGAWHTVTVTAGVSAIDASCSFDQAVSRADEALYRGKAAGRNRVEVANPQFAQFFEDSQKIE